MNINGRFKKVSTLLLCLIIFAAIVKCGGGGGGGDGGGGGAATADVSGYWQGTAPATPGGWYMQLTLSGTTVSGSFICTANMAVTGSVNGNNVNLSFNDEGCVNQIAATLSGTSMSGTATLTIDSALGTCSETPGTKTFGMTQVASNPCTESSEVNLEYSPSGTDKWWLSVKVITAQIASRVYVTGSYITGQYDLYACSAHLGVTPPLYGWWSSNNAACTNETPNNYKVTTTPTLPFDVVIHIVTTSGEVTINKTITSYSTN